MSVDDVGEGLEAAPKLLLMLLESIFLSFGRFFSVGGGEWWRRAVAGVQVVESKGGEGRRLVKARKVLLVLVGWTWRSSSRVASGEKGSHFSWIYITNAMHVV